MKNHIICVEQYVIEINETPAGLEIEIHNESGDKVATDLLVHSEICETIKFLAEYL